MLRYKRMPSLQYSPARNVASSVLKRHNWEGNAWCESSLVCPNSGTGFASVDQQTCYRKTLLLLLDFM